MMKFSIFVVLILLNKSDAENVPENTTELIKATSNDKNLDDENDDTEARIIGGDLAEPGQFPYAVSFRLNGMHFCGGAILDKRWAITATHCFPKEIEVDKVSLVVGTNKLYSPTGYIHKISGLVCHDKFDISTFSNDICLIRVEPDIIFNFKVKPLPLFSGHVPMGSSLTMIGWGDEQHQGALSNQLKFVHLKKITLYDCRRKMGMYISPTLMCTLGKKDLEGTCNGDSGGPLTYRGELVGISIWGLMCAAGYPDAFTNIALYKDWIKQTTHMYNEA